MILPFESYSNTMNEYNFVSDKSQFLMGKSPFLMGKSPFLIGTSLHFPCCQTSNCFPERSWSWAVRTRLLWGCITLKTATKSAAVHTHLALLGPDGMGRDEELGRLGKWLVFTHRNGVFNTKKCGFHPQLCKRTQIFSCSGTLWSTNLAMANDPLYNWVNHHENHLYLWAIASYMQFFLFPG